MTPDQVSAFFDAGEGFIEGTIAAALVVLWLLALALHLGRVVHGPHHRQVHAPARRRPVVDHLRRPARPHRRPGLPRQLHLLLPGRRGRPGLADHRGPRRRVRVRCPPDQADPAQRRGVRLPLAGPAPRARGDALHRAVPPRRPDDRAPRQERRAARADARDQSEPRRRPAAVLPVGLAGRRAGPGRRGLQPALDRSRDRPLARARRPPDECRRSCQQPWSTAQPAGWSCRWPRSCR